MSGGDALSLARRIWRLAPEVVRFSAAGALARAGLRVPPPPPPARLDRGLLCPGPVIVSGFFSDERGIGRAARLTADAIERAGFALLRDDLTPMLHHREPVPLAAPEGGVWLLHCNAPETAVAMRVRTALAHAPLLRIAAWSWELPAAPKSWIVASGLFHEVWTPSAFVAGAFAQSAATVRVMPHPVVALDEGPPLRMGDGVRFSALADMRSSAARKNPQAVLRAWIDAFPQPGAHRLTLKLLAPEAEPAVAARLSQLARGRTDVTLLAQAMDEAALASFYAATDVVVSLHRAEGFGLTLAEAMAAGKPVIATGWSGNLEFMDAHDPDQIVPCRPIPVHDPRGRYKGGAWADPDHGAAVASLRRLAGDAGLRRRLGEANRARIAALHTRWSPEAFAATPFARFATRAPWDPA